MSDLCLFHVIRLIIKIRLNFKYADIQIFPNNDKLFNLNICYIWIKLNGNEHLGNC